MSQSKVSCASGDSSRASEIGRISSSANLRAVICQARCSLLSEKSMSLSLSFRGEHGSAAPVVCASASAMRSLASAVPSPECRQIRASCTYFCSGMSRITPMAPKHSAASLAAR